MPVLKMMTTTSGDGILECLDNGSKLTFCPWGSRRTQALLLGAAARSLFCKAKQLHLFHLLIQHLPYICGANSHCVVLGQEFPHVKLGSILVPNVLDGFHGGFETSYLRLGLEPSHTSGGS